ncbi:hypothetical protein VNI00_014281 [Paramarasmius palmivorus]|uniref:Uncharacterized protein n=1 Tax=Paramarasmius palmivorus TaxID=297713 RepID=A0AAW0BU41_9AGAR
MAGKKRKTTTTKKGISPELATARSHHHGILSKLGKVKVALGRAEEIIKTLSAVEARTPAEDKKLDQNRIKLAEKMAQFEVLTTQSLEQETLVKRLEGSGSNEDSNAEDNGSTNHSNEDGDDVGALDDIEENTPPTKRAKSRDFLSSSERDGVRAQIASGSPPIPRPSTSPVVATHVVPDLPVSPLPESLANSLPIDISPQPAPLPPSSPLQDSSMPISRTTILRPSAQQTFNDEVVSTISQTKVTGSEDRSTVNDPEEIAVDGITVPPTEHVGLDKDERRVLHTEITPLTLRATNPSMSIPRSSQDQIGEASSDNQDQPTPSPTSGAVDKHHGTSEMRMLPVDSRRSFAASRLASANVPKDLGNPRGDRQVQITASGGFGSPVQQWAQNDQLLFQPSGNEPRSTSTAQEQMDPWGSYSNGPPDIDMNFDGLNLLSSVAMFPNQSSFEFLPTASSSAPFHLTNDFSQDLIMAGAIPQMENNVPFSYHGTSITNQVPWQMAATPGLMMNVPTHPAISANYANSMAKQLYTMQGPSNPAVSFTHGNGFVSWGPETQWSSGHLREWDSDSDTGPTAKAAEADGYTPYTDPLDPWTPGVSKLGLSRTASGMSLHALMERLLRPPDLRAGEDGLELGSGLEETYKYWKKRVAEDCKGQGAQGTKKNDDDDSYVKKAEETEQQYIEKMEDACHDITQMFLKTGGDYFVPFKFREWVRQDSRFARLAGLVCAELAIIVLTTETGMVKCIYHHYSDKSFKNNDYHMQQQYLKAHEYALALQEKLKQEEIEKAKKREEAKKKGMEKEPVQEKEHVKVTGKEKAKAKGKEKAKAKGKEKEKVQQAPRGKSKGSMATAPQNSSGAVDTEPSADTNSTAANPAATHSADNNSANPDAKEKPKGPVVPCFPKFLSTGVPERPVQTSRVGKKHKKANDSEEVEEVVVVVAEDTCNTEAQDGEKAESNDGGAVAESSDGKPYPPLAVLRRGFGNCGCTFEQMINSLYQWKWQSHYSPTLDLHEMWNSIRPQPRWRNFMSETAARGGSRMPQDYYTHLRVRDLKGGPDAWKYVEVHPETLLTYRIENLTRVRDALSEERKKAEEAERLAKEAERMAEEARKKAEAELDNMPIDYYDCFHWTKIVLISRVMSADRIGRDRTSFDVIRREWTA